MGVRREGEKARLHIKDKFLGIFGRQKKEVKMGTWGITVRESDYGLDLLDLLILQQLKEADFAIFNVSEAIELL